MKHLIERLQKSAEHVRSTSKGGMEYEARLMEEAAAALESAREDAERYRWLRDANINTLPYDGYGIGPGFPCGDDLDATIDAAMSKEGK